MKPARGVGRWLVLLSGWAVLGVCLAQAPQPMPMDNDQRRASIAALDRYIAEDAEVQAAGLLEGVQVDSLVPGGNAARAGVRAGEFVLRYGGEPARNSVELKQRIGARAGTAGDVELQLLGLDARVRTVRVPAGPVGIGLRDIRWVRRAPMPQAPRIYSQAGHAQIQGFAVNADQSIAVSHGLSGSLKVWDLRAGKELMSLQPAAPGLLSLAVSPSGRWSAATNAYSKLLVWDNWTGRLHWEVNYQVQPKVLFEADDRHMLVHEGSVIARMDLQVQTMAAAWFLPAGPTYSQVRSVSVDPSGRIALLVTAELETTGWNLGSSSGRARLLRLSTGEWSTVPADKGDVVSAVMSGDTDTVYLGYQDGRVLRSKLTDGRWTALPVPHSGAVTALRYSPDGRRLLSEGPEALLREAQSGSVISRLAEPRKVMGWSGKTSMLPRLAQTEFAADGQALWLVENMGASDLQSSGSDDGSVYPAIQLVPPQGGRGLKELPRAPAHQASAIYAPTSTLVTVNSSGLVQFWQLGFGRLLGAWRLPKGQAARAISFASEGQQVLVATTAGEQSPLTRLSMHEVASGRLLRSWSVGSGQLAGLIVSPKGDRAVSSVQGSSEVKVWNLHTGERLATLEGRSLTQRVEAAISGHDFLLFDQFSFSPDGARLFVADRFGQGGLLWDVSRQAVVQRFNGNAGGNVVAGSFISDGRLLLGGQRLLGVVDGNTGVELKRLWTAPPPPAGVNPAFANLFVSSRDDDLRIERVAVEPSGQRGAVVRGNRIEIWHLGEGRRMGQLIGHSGAIQQLQFSQTGERLYTFSDDGTMRTWDTASGRELVQMLATPDGEWLAITLQGYFNASSPKAAQHITVKVGHELFSLDQLFETFYRPDIVAAALEGRDDQALMASTVAEALQQVPPRMPELAAPQGTSGDRVLLRYSVRGRVGGIGDVRVYHNGKLIRSRERGTTVAATGPAAVAAPGMGRALNAASNEAVEVELRGMARQAKAAKLASVGPAADAKLEEQIDIEPVAGTNEVMVLAFNQRNTVAAEVGRLNFESQVPARPPRLLVLAIGINEYRDPTAQLKFAAKDARDVVARFERQAQMLYGQGQVQVRTLLDGEATRTQVLAQLDQLAQNARPTDHVLVFVAGHGVMVDGTYHMVTSDYAGSLQAQNTVSADDIVERSKRIPALSQWLIFDTCHAGGLGSIVSGLYDSRVQVLARQTGMHVFASASTTQQALDGFEGNGLFTHALLKGIGADLAADADSDRQVRITELGQFAKALTRTLATQVRHQQDPLIVHHGQDRVVARRP